MASIKNIQVAFTMGSKYTMEGKIRDHVVQIDQPKMAGGDDKGPTPLEYQLVSLAGCMGAIARIIANQRRLPLRGMEVQVSGDLNVDFLLGRTKEGRAGFTGIKVLVKIDADMSLEEKKKFLHEVDERCPISESLMNVTPVTVELAG